MDEDFRDLVWRLSKEVPFNSFIRNEIVVKHETVIKEKDEEINRLKDDYVKGCNDTTDEWKDRIKHKIKTIPRHSMTPLEVEAFLKEI